jgi:hypothetical protein
VSGRYGLGAQTLSSNSFFYTFTDSTFNGVYSISFQFYSGTTCLPIHHCSASTELMFLYPSTGPRFWYYSYGYLGSTLPNLAANTWNHVVLTFNVAAGQNYVYIEGLQYPNTGITLRNFLNGDKIT